MTPDQFIDKWSRADRTERQAAQEHFIDLCRLIGEPTPNEADDPGAYTFEKGVSKTDGRAGFADVWKRGSFGWEYKKQRANLDLAYQQLLLYSVALENPPLLVVCDTKTFRVYTNWTNTVQERHEFTLQDLARTEIRDLLRNVFRNPEELKPAKTREQVTREAAKEFSTIAERMRMSGHPPEKVAHFLNRLVFCLFAQNVGLLQDDLFRRLLRTLEQRRETLRTRSVKMLSVLFATMREGGEYGLEQILHFNGGLFDDNEALPLDFDSFDILRRIARQDWSSIDPSIFGTLFERFLDPDKRAQIGAHYTDAGKIMMILEPVLRRPVVAEWEGVKAELVAILAKGRIKDGKPGKAAIDKAEARLDVFLDRLAGVRVLDPACGSGNFLYLALQVLKDLEQRVLVEAVELGLKHRIVRCGPQNVKGIEINPYAAELARTSIWIGNIQWLRRNGFEAKKEPVLEPLDAIECRDALVTRQEDGSYVEAEWPQAEFIVGNPPFLGGKLMRRALGDDYVLDMRRPFHGRLSEFADLVCYWFDKANRQLDEGVSRRAGLVATNSIRGGANRRVLDDMSEKQTFIEAWSDEPWVVDGAAVRVSIICFGQRIESESIHLNGCLVERINADLTAGSMDLTTAHRLQENGSVCFEGGQKHRAFEIDGRVAREFLLQPRNPNGRPNADVIYPYLNATSLVPEVVPGYPDRILPKTEAAAAELKKRTLTNLYNARPQWLADAHRDLDAAVAAAYGWPADISEDEALAKLLALNLERAGSGTPPVLAPADDEADAQE
jgi:type II restriction/modification system DNA methylase subunit YeeA